MNPAWTLVSLVYLALVAAVVSAAVREDDIPRIVRRAAATFALLAGGTGFFWGLVALIQLVG